MEEKKQKMSLEEVITSKDKLRKINSAITYYWIKLVLPIIIIFIALAVSYFSKTEYLNDFESRDVFTCTSVLKDSIKITIDKKDGWKLEDGYFVKEGNKISIKRCKALKKEDNE